MEADAERVRMAERRQRRNRADAEKHGETLLDLVILDHAPGLGGRFLLTFGKRNRTQDLPWNRFKVGSPVILSNDDGNSSEVLFGVVSKRSGPSLQVAVEDWPEGEHFRLDLSADEVSRLRQLSALQSVEHARGRLAQLRDVLLGEREPKFSKPLDLEISDELNASQQEAVNIAMQALDLAIIHGPPGTGKTTTVVELARQSVLRGEKVLATAPSNTAVDNLLERLADLNLRVVRIGHPARVHETLQAHTLDYIVQCDPGMEVVQEMMREAEQLSRQASKFTRARPVAGSKQNLRAEAKRLREDARRYERHLIAAALDNADIICATTTYDPEILGDRQFDLAIIDEACQSTEPGCWPVTLRAQRIVLAGDHLQLPPTVISIPAAHEGFSVSLMERLVHLYGNSVTRQLDVQYRMHDQIMEFSSKQFYQGNLVSHNSVKDHLLCDLPSIQQNALTQSPLLFIDSAGANWDEELEPDGESKRNPNEGKLVLELVDQLVRAGVHPLDIAVIAPYAAQVRWLREYSQHSSLEIDTVDGFQGREKEVVVISLVRSNSTGEIGFLADTRRMNVALTRARRKLIVIGDSATLGGNAFYAKLIDYFEQHASYRSVWEFDFN